MSCNRIEELLVAYLENDLTERERREVDAHLSSCVECRRSLKSFATLEESLGTLKGSATPWKTAEARFSRRAGFARRRIVPAFIFNAPVLAGLSFVGLGIALFLTGDVLFPAMQSAGAWFAAAFDGLGRALSPLFADAASVNIFVLLAVYGLLTLAFIGGTSAFAFRFGRK